MAGWRAASDSIDGGGARLWRGAAVVEVVLDKFVPGNRWCVTA